MKKWYAVIWIAPLLVFIVWLTLRTYPVPHTFIGWVALILLGVPLMLLAESGDSPISAKFGRTWPRPVRWFAQFVVLGSYICLLYVGIVFVMRVIQS